MSDSEISIALLKAGDRTELAKMVETFANPIYRLGLKITTREQDAEDVLQQTFEKAIRALPNFEERSSLATWLFRIAYNEALMLLRKHKPQVSLDADPEEDGDDNPQPPMELADWSALPEAELLTGETGAVLNEAIAALPLRYRSVFLLRDVEGLSIRETAEALRISEPAVKTRLMRARIALREQLAHYFGERMRQKED